MIGYSKKQKKNIPEALSEIIENVRKEAIQEETDLPEETLNEKSKSEINKSDSPFGKASELVPLKKQEIQQDIPIQQAVMQEDKEDDLPFGMPVNKQETLQNKETDLADDNDNVTIVTQFSVIDGVIIHNKSNEMIADTPIDVLKLSVRSYHALRRGKIDTVADLIQLTKSDLEQIRNLGIKSREEILKSLNLYLIKKIPENFLFQKHFYHLIVLEKKHLTRLSLIKMKKSFCFRLYWKMKLKQMKCLLFTKRK